MYFQKFCLSYFNVLNFRHVKFFTDPKSDENLERRRFATQQNFENMKREHMAMKEAAVVKEQSCVRGHHIYM